MAEHPILFSGPMVRAILDGRKTQTRRVVKPQPAYHPVFQNELHWRGMDLNPDSTYRCPYGVPSDWLWVRETWMLDGADVRPAGMEWDRRVIYRADNPENGELFKWKPSIFMPRWASRLTLGITAVRVERLQEISAANAMWEGIERAHLLLNRLTIEALGNASSTGLAAIDDYAVLWDSLNAKRGYSWESNPWVWVITFEKEPKEE